MRASIVSIIVCGLTAPAVAGTSAIPLTVHETAGIDRRQDLVTTGIPIPIDADLHRTDVLRIVDAAGREVSAQFRVLSRWYAEPGDEAAPIRWVLADFAAGVPAGGDAAFELRADRPPAPIDRPITILETADGISVSTGAAAFRIARDTFNLFDGVSLDLDGDGSPDDVIVTPRGDGGVVVVREDGSHYTSTDDAAPTSVVVEERGPIRTVVRVDGRLQTHTQNDAYPGALDYLEYTARYHFVRGRSDVRLQFTLRNPDRSKAASAHSGGEEVFHTFDELALELPVRTIGANRFGAIGESPLGGALEAEDRVLLYQDSSGGPNWGPSNDGSPYWSTTFPGYRVAHGAAIVDSGLRALGVVDLSGDTAGLATSVRDFWQEFPKGLEVFGTGRVCVQLFPGSWATPHRFRGGVQKTNDVLFDFHAGSAASADVEAAARAFQSPMRALAAPIAYRDSRALGLISIPDATAFRTYEESMAGVLDYAGQSPLAQGDLFREMEDKDEYGWLNWGDHYREGEKNLRYWGNNEFDFSWVLLLGYLRTPGHDDRYFQLGRASARHLMDVDLYHTDLDLFWANRGVRKHDASGVTDHSRDPNLSHFWVDGLILYYWLTGDEGARDAMHEIESWLHAREEDPVRAPGRLSYAGEVRSKGWMLQALVALFECLGDRRDFDLAQRMIPVEIAAVTTPEGWLPNSIGLVDPWMHGYVTEGLGRFCLVARALGEPIGAVRELLVRILHFQSTLAWSDARGEMAYTWDPRTRQATSYSSNLSQTAVNGFAYAFLLTGGADFLAWAGRCYDSYYRYHGYPYFYSTTLLTPEKNTGFKLRFGQAYMNVLQTSIPGDDGHEPQISDVTVDTIGWTSAIVRFVTSEPADALVVAAASGGGTVTGDQRGFFQRTHAVRLRGLAPGTSYRVTISSRDFSGDDAAPATATFRTLDPDVTPPVLGSVVFDDVTAHSATVHVTTDEPTSATIGWTPRGGETTTSDDAAGLVTDHTFTIPLAPDTAYSLRVTAADVWGNVATSPVARFRSSVEVVVPVEFDGFLIANYSGTRVSTSGSIEVRDNANLHYDALLRFDLTPIPASTTLQSATLELVKESGNTTTVVVRGVRHTSTSSRVPVPAIGFDPADPCYHYRDLSRGVAWTAEGGGADDAMGPPAGRLDVTSRDNGVVAADVTGLARTWVSGAEPNEGLFLEVHDTSQYVVFRSSEDPTPTLRPRLRLVYRR